MSRLDEIETRLSAATPGPWLWRNSTEPYLTGARTRIVMAFRRMGLQGAQPQFRNTHGLLADAGRENINTFPDAELIAHAPSDIADLASAVRKVEEVAVPVGITPSDDPWWHGHEEAMRRVRVQLAPLTETAETT